MTPAVSVVIPVRDGAAFLPGAIATVDAEDDGSLEIIVVDDGSTDATPALAADLAALRPGRMRVIRIEPRGPAAARNAGIAAARGAAIALLDVDDLWPPGRLRALLAPLAADHTLEAVVGRLEANFMPDSEGFWSRTEFRKGPVLFPHLGAALLRPALFARIGMFDETMRYGEDIDFYLRLLESGPRLRAISDLVLLYRLHARNMTLDRAAVSAATYSVTMRSIVRRRQAGGLRRMPKLADFLAGAEGGR